MLTIVTNTGFWFEELKVDSMSDEGFIWKLAAPMSPTRK
jgi:hypothetical protein